MSEKLPEGWAPTSLGGLISGFEAGRNLRSEGRAAREDEYGVLKISAVTWGEFRPTENKALLAGDEPKSHERIRKNDLLVTRANTSDLVGAVVLVDRDYPNLMLPDKILRLCPTASLVDPGFLLYALRTPEVREHFQANATGTSESMRNLSQPKLAAAPVPLAPRPEQRRIFAAVETLMAEVSATRARLAKVSLILKRFRRAVLAAACSGRLTEEWRLAHPHTQPGVDLIQRIASARQRAFARRATGGRPRDYVVPAPLIGGDIADIPAGWCWVRLEQVCDFITKGTTPSSDRMRPSGEVPFVKIQHLTNSGALCFESSPAFIDRETHTAGAMRRSTVLPGDILINIVGPPLGQAALVPASFPEWNTNQAIAILRPIEGLVRGYLLRAVLCDQIIGWAISRANTTVGQHNLTLELVRNLPIPLPGEDEQYEIVRRVDALFALADSIERRLAVAIARTDKLPQAILAKAFRGELVPTEAELARTEGRDYEPAGALLERIHKERETAGPIAGRGRKKPAPAKAKPTAAP